MLVMGGRGGGERSTKKKKIPQLFVLKERSPTVKCRPSLGLYSKSF